MRTLSLNIILLSSYHREREHEEWLERERVQVGDIRAKQGEEDEKQRQKEETEVGSLISNHNHDMLHLFSF